MRDGSPPPDDYQRGYEAALSWCEDQQQAEDEAHAEALAEARREIDRVSREWRLLLAYATRLHQAFPSHVIAKTIEEEDENGILAHLFGHARVVLERYDRIKELERKLAEAEARAERWKRAWAATSGTVEEKRSAYNDLREHGDLPDGG